MKKMIKIRAVTKKPAVFKGFTVIWTDSQEIAPSLKRSGQAIKNFRKNWVPEDSLMVFPAPD